MRRFITGRKGWSVAALALVALMAAGAIQAGVSGRSGEGGAETATVGRDAAAPAIGVPEPAFQLDGGAAISPVAGAGGVASTGRAASSANSGAQIAPVPPGGNVDTVVPGAPRIVRTADLRVKLGKGAFGAAFDQVASLAAANGGFVSASTTAATDDARSGQITVRVPADRFDAVRLGLSGLGEVESQSIRGEDVSGQLVDFEARLRSLQAQEEALRVLVGEAKAVGEVLQVQSSLFSVRQQIEQLKGQQANVEQAATLATLNVSLFEPGAAIVTRPPTDDPSLARSVRQAVDGAMAVVGGMIVVVGYLVPIALLGLLLWGASKVFRRRPAPAV